MCCRKGLRTETSIVVETAQCFSTHHVALLVGYGAHAVSPYLAFETCRQWRASSRCVVSFCVYTHPRRPLLPTTCWFVGALCVW